MLRNLMFVVDAIRAYRAGNTAGPSGPWLDPRKRAVGEAVNAWRAARAGQHTTALRFVMDAVKAFRASRPGHTRSSGTSSQMRAIMEAVKAYRAARKGGRL